MFVSICLIASVVFAICGIVYSDDRPSINVDRLAVVTVLDLSNREIVNDALTLFRSIRLFGSELNKATIVGCIITDSIEEIPDEFWSQTLQSLAQLRIQLTFVRSAPRGAKTLNKIEALKAVDTLRFDYILWLDADTFIFRDITPYLKQHTLPGQIECIPELYSYLR